MGQIASLGGALASGTGIIGNAANTLISSAQSSNELSNLKSQQNLEQEQQQTNTNAQLQQIELQSQQDEQDRLKALKSAVAKQRAAFGASGVSSSDSGSASAVVTGYLNDSNSEKSQNEKTNNLKKQALTDSLNQTKQKNLLELSEKENENKWSNLFNISSIL